MKVHTCIKAVKRRKCYGANKCSTSQLTVQTRFPQEVMRVRVLLAKSDSWAEKKNAHLQVRLDDTHDAMQWYVLCTLCMLWLQAMRSAFFCQTQWQSCYTVNKVIKVFSLNYAKCMQIVFIQWTTISHKSFVV